MALPMAAAASKSNSSEPKPDKDGKYWLETDHMKLGFVPFGAAISDLRLNDKHGVERDIVAGFDNATYYTIDEQKPNFGVVPGRYANRIKNATFEIDGEWYNITANDNDGLDALHGGENGWGLRNWTVASYSDDSITFSILDEDGEEGFPGEVLSYVTYTVDGWDWDIKIVALSLTKKTPIMLTSHTYWNLDGFANNETSSALNHTLHMPYSGQRVGVDNILIPTGDILPNAKGSVNDFWSEPKQIGASWDDEELEGNCGFNCTGYDNCWTVNREQMVPYDWRTSGPVVTLSSEWSGIQIDVFSDQDAFQMYSCNFQNGSMALKSSQGIEDDEDFPRTIPQYGCVVLEPQDYIDGINHPEWFRTKKQIFGPGDDPYVFQARYSFSVNDDKKEKCGHDEL
ncbi:aldose 1-epimerase domain-containing protein [Sarocladium implicatum]|nr:aldose 1-epimerase domain-containing protein [Sarocladium implicatum]